MGRSRGPLAAAAADDDGAWFGHRSKRRRIVLGVDSLDPGATGDGKRPPLYHCNYCHKDISGTIRIKCAKCSDYDLCVECFSVGAETYPHKCNHPYRVMDNLAFPLIYPDWNADEEILLLEAVEMCGVGNWGDVGEHVGTKTKAQCYEHYMTAYMNSPFSPLPDMRQVMGKSRADLLAFAKLQADGKKNLSVGMDPLRLVKQEPTISPARIKYDVYLSVMCSYLRVGAVPGNNCGLFISSFRLIVSDLMNQTVWASQSYPSKPSSLCHAWRF